MGTKYNPDQWDLFADLFNRDELPVDAKRAPEDKPLPPLIAAAIQSIHEQLEGLNLDSRPSSEAPPGGH